MKGQPLIIWGLLIGSWVLARAQTLNIDIPQAEVMHQKTVKPLPLVMRRLAAPAYVRIISKPKSPSSISAEPNLLQAENMASQESNLPTTIPTQMASGSIAFTPAPIAMPAYPEILDAEKMLTLKRDAPTSMKRLSGDIWLFSRSSGGASSTPILGGGQAGGRLKYSIPSPASPLRLSASARLARPLRGQGLEVSPVLSIAAGQDIPIEMIIERRIRPEKGAKDQWGLLIASGISPKQIRPGISVEGFAQAGVVGTRKPIPFAQIGLGLHQSIYDGTGLQAKVGAGFWADGQGKVGRIDIGPELAAVAKIGKQSLRLSAQWRIKVAGNAKPGSGPALSVATSF